MSTVAEIKAAFEGLDLRQRREIYRWITQREDFQHQQFQDLRRDLGLGLDQADRGELAPLDIEAVKRDARRRHLAQAS